MANVKPEIREKVLLEILNTERAYVEDLRIIREVYMTPLKESGIITPDQQKTLFANVDEIENINRHQVLASLENKFKQAHSQGIPVHKIQLGEIFQELSEHLKQYTEYCSHNPGALAMLDDLEKADAEFAAFTKNLMDNDSVVRGLSLLSFIIKPVQRLCKYPLLIRELMNNSDPNEDVGDYQKLADAATKVNKTVEFVNAMQKEADAIAQQKLTEIAGIEAKIEGAEALELAIDKNRSITRFGDVTRIIKKKPQIRLLYLFNNLLVLASPKKKPNKTQTHKLDWFSKIQDLVVTDLGDDAVNGIESGFELKKNGASSDENLVILCCATPTEKRAWIKDLRTHIKDWQSREAKRRQNVLRAASSANLNSGMITTRSSSDKSKQKSAVKKNVEKKPGVPVKPDPPADDGFEGWKQKQEDEKSIIYPLGSPIPDQRWNDWLQYSDPDTGIPFFYHLRTKESTWQRPQGFGAL